MALPWLVARTQARALVRVAMWLELGPDLRGYETEMIALSALHEERLWSETVKLAGAKSYRAPLLRSDDMS